MEQAKTKSQQWNSAIDESIKIACAHVALHFRVTATEIKKLRNVLESLKK